jgi:hypothetical protein
MLHYDYTWDLYPNYLKLDEELPVDKLGWQEGDMFRLVITENGTRLLKKIDPIEKFVLGHGNE